MCAGAKEGEGRRASCPSSRTSGHVPDIRPQPDIRPLPRKSGIGYPESTRVGQVSPDIRPPGPDIRPVASHQTSGPAPGNPAPHHRSWTLPARTSGPSARISGVSGRPGHSTRRPDIRPICLRAAHLGRGPCTPSYIRLYILPHLLLVRVSKGLAHLEIELCSSISDLLHDRDRGPSSETIHLGFKTSSRRRPPSRPPYGEEPVTVVSSFVGFESCILPLCSSI